MKIAIYPPTPAFAKAGAAPGTTAGVDLVLFQTLQTFTLKQLPQQAPQGQGHSNDFLWVSKLPFASPQRLQTHPKIPNPQGQGHSNETFYRLSKLPFASPQRPQTFQNKIPNTFLNRHPRAKATSPTGTPGPGHSNGFLWAFKAAVCQPANPLKLSKRSKPSKTRQTLQTPSPAGTPDPQQWLSWCFQGSRSQPAKAATPPKFQILSLTRGQGHSNDFLWASKLQFATLQKIQTSKIPNTFPNMHPRAKATSPTGTPGPGPRPLPQQAPRARPQQWLSMGFQSYRLPARKRSKTLQTLQTLQNPPNPPNTVPSRHPRSTAMTFLRLSKLPFASPQRLQPPQNSEHLP